MPAAKQIIVYWRDIPSQVIVKLRRTSGKVMLSERFQVAVDRAAMRAGKGSSDAYIAQWRRESQTYRGEDDYQQVAERIAAQIEADYSDERLSQLIKNNGNGPDKSKDASIND